MHLQETTLCESVTEGYHQESFTKSKERVAPTRVRCTKGYYKVTRSYLSSFDYEAAPIVTSSTGAQHGLECVLSRSEP